MLDRPRSVWFNTGIMSDGKPGYDDPFRPPDIPTEVFCLHCGLEYESYLIHWVTEELDDEGDGFWSCPTPGCDGVGFCFDIWPTDPEWRDENGEKVTFFDDRDEDAEEGESEGDLGDETVEWAAPPDAEGDDKDPPDSPFDDDIPC